MPTNFNFKLNMAMHHRNDQRHGVRRVGAALVEFAVILPVILLIFFGMIEISRVLLLQHTADTAAYEGARCAMVPGGKSLDANAAANQLLKSAGVKSGVVRIFPDVITEKTSILCVRVEIPINANAWVGPQFFTAKSVVSEVTLFCERPPLIVLTGVPEMHAIALGGGLGSLTSALGVSASVAGTNLIGNPASTSSGLISISVAPTLALPSAAAASQPLL